MTDAVVIGAGPNGLVAANLLADRGWKVVVLEATDRPGGAVKSSELIEPGFVNDEFSAFYPLAASSPIIASLRLDDYGLKWRRSPYMLAQAGMPLAALPAGQYPLVGAGPSGFSLPKFAMSRDQGRAGQRGG